MMAAAAAWLWRSERAWAEERVSSARSTVILVLPRSFSANDLVLRPLSASEMPIIILLIDSVLQTDKIFAIA